VAYYRTMEAERATDRLLSRIIIYGFALAFGLIAASLEALRPGPNGFTLRISGWTLVALFLAAAAMLLCFHVIVYSRRKLPRRAALTLVTGLGLAAFFYPLRMVPQEKFRPIFIGLGVAVLALSFLATMLFLLYRYFEREGG
jgi:hypothetical protein